MAGSTRYVELRRALTKLRRHLLPRRFDPTGAYRAKASVHIRAVSFRMLIHAEIESFLEGRASDLAGAAMAVWNSRRIASDVTVGMLAFGGIETARPPGRLGGDSNNQKAYEDLDVAFQRANNVWRHELKNNHGVKEANVLNLFLPLGIQPTSLDSTLLADLSSYGALRGEVAHASSLSAATLADPKTEFDKARQLIDDLRKLDDAVAAAIKRIELVSKALP